MALFRHASVWNGYMPKASKQVIGYALDPKKYALNEIIQYTPSEKDRAIWTIIARDDFIRIDDADDLVWHEANYSPQRRGNRLRHKTDEALLIRRRNSTMLGENEMKQFEFYGLQELHLHMLMTQLMTQRAVRVTAMLETSGNWNGNTDTATNKGGGKWDVGTEQDPYFANGINNVVIAINKATNGMITHKDLICTMNPDDAGDVAKTAEIRQYMSRSEFALMMQQDPYGMVNQQYGIPAKYCGVKLRVDGSLKVTTKDPGDAGTDAGTRGFIKTGDSMYFTTRPGGVMGVPGGESFSTVTAFYAGDTEKFQTGDGEVSVSGADLMFQVESFPEPKHRLTELFVTEKMIEVITAPETGYYVTDTMT